MCFKGILICRLQETYSPIAYEECWPQIVEQLALKPRFYISVLTNTYLS